MGTQPVRVLLLSDTHGHLDPRIESLASDCDVVVHAGDVGADEVLDRLSAHRAALYAVRGNNDEARKWRGDPARIERDLPLSQTLDLPGGLLVAVHGDRAGAPARRHARLRREFPGVRAVVYGHSHRACVDRGAVPWILNPGVAGRSRTFGGPSCLVLLAAHGDWALTEHRFEPIARPGRRAAGRAG